MCDVLACLIFAIIQCLFRCISSGYLIFLLKKIFILNLHALARENLFQGGARVKISDYRSSGIKLKAHIGTPLNVE